MTHWQKYYTERPLTVARSDYLKQVGHTLHGEPVSDAQFQDMVSQICSLLELGPDDSLLDLCCGNGLITRELARKCRTVVGVDFSQPLLQIAKEDHSADNINYHHLNVMHLNRLENTKAGKFSKILMYASLQHFEKSHLKNLLVNILNLSEENRIILFGFIPDIERKWEFYDTRKRQMEYFIRRLTGRELIGTWWRKDFIELTSRDLNLGSSFHSVPENLHANIYRFNAKIS